MECCGRSAGPNGAELDTPAGASPAAAKPATSALQASLSADALARTAGQEGFSREVCFLLDHGLFEEALELLDARASQPMDCATEALRQLAHQLLEQYETATANVSSWGFNITTEDANMQLLQSSFLFKMASSSPLCLALNAWLLHCAGRHFESEALCQAVEVIAQATLLMHAVLRQDATAATCPDCTHTAAAAPCSSAVASSSAPSPTATSCVWKNSSLLRTIHSQCSSAVLLCTCLRLLRTMVSIPFTPRNGMRMQTLVDDLLVLTRAIEFTVCGPQDSPASPPASPPAPLLSPSTSSPPTSPTATHHTFRPVNTDTAAVRKPTPWEVGGVRQRASPPPQGPARVGAWVLRLLPGVADLEDIKVHVSHLCLEQDACISRAHLMCLVEEGGASRKRRREQQTNSDASVRLGAVHAKRARPLSRLRPPAE